MDKPTVATPDNLGETSLQSVKKWYANRTYGHKLSHAAQQGHLIPSDAHNLDHLERAKQQNFSVQVIK